MNKTILVYVGLMVYVTILVTSFLHVLDSFMLYNTKDIVLNNLVIPGWLAGFGVAIGLDLAVIYFSFVGVLTGSRIAKQGSVYAMLLVWFAVAYSMVHSHFPAMAAGDSAAAISFWVGLILSMFVPLTGLRVGQVLGELAGGKSEDPKPSLLSVVTGLLRNRAESWLQQKLGSGVQYDAEGQTVEETYLSTDEVIRLAGITRQAFINDWKTGRLKDVRAKRIVGDSWLWCKEDLDKVYGKHEEVPNTAGPSQPSSAAGTV
ncbi:MAG: hypothetical protein SFU83_19485 [Meiothermus sp.]|nr:hypothetical protein [Meiothermus sp.]